MTTAAAIPTIAAVDLVDDLTIDGAHWDVLDASLDIAADTDGLHDAIRRVLAARRMALGSLDADRAAMRVDDLTRIRVHLTTDDFDYDSVLAAELSDAIATAVANA